MSTQNKTQIFLKETKEMLKRHWMLCIYAVLLMAGTSYICFRAMPYREAAFSLQDLTSCLMVPR